MELKGDNTMTANLNKNIIILIVTIIVVVLIFNMPWLTILIGGTLSPQPNEPKIKHGEFPLKLEYELNGKVYTVEDVLICDFKGYGFSEGNGEKYRKWSYRLASGKTRISLVNTKGKEILFFPLRSGSNIGGVFMGDNEEFYAGGIGDVFPDAWYTSDFEDNQKNLYIISAEDMLENYKLKLIKWEIASPIHNSFS